MSDDDDTARFYLDRYASGEPKAQITVGQIGGEWFTDYDLGVTRDEWAAMDITERAETVAKAINDKLHAAGILPEGMSFEYGPVK